MLVSSLLLTIASLATAARGASVPTTASGVLRLVPDVESTAAARANHGLVARTVDPAVRLTQYEGRQCGGWEAPYRAADGACYRLEAGDGLRIREIADTCRVFFYAGNGCTGAEFQGYPGNCYDIHAFYTMKVFCH